MLSGVTVLKMMPAHCFLFTQDEIRGPSKANHSSDKCVIEGENKGGIKLTWYNWKAHEVM